MYGGLTPDSTTTVAQAKVFVLSLPSFVWQTENSVPSHGRFLHSCNIVGQRQMMVIGGIVTNEIVAQDQEGPQENKESIQFTDHCQPDPQPQGISIFDLSSFEWKDSYNATALPYTSPDIVKNMIFANGSDPPWSNTLVQSWFNTSLKATNPRPPSPKVTASSNTTPERNTGGIIGGVIGGVTFVIITAAILSLWFRRMRRKRARDVQNEVHHSSATGYSPDDQNAELPGHGLFEMSSGCRPSEMPAHEISEVQNHEVFEI